MNSIVCEKSSRECKQQFEALIGGHSKRRRSKRSKVKPKNPPTNTHLLKRTTESMNFLLGPPSLPVSVKKQSFWASPCLAQSFSRNCYPAPALVLRKPIFLIVLCSGVFFFRHRYAPLSLLRRRSGEATADLRTEILDFRGSDSSRILI